MMPATMNFEQFAKRHKEIMSEATSFHGTALQATDEEMFKIYVGLYVLQEHIAKVTKEEKLYRRVIK